MSIQKWKQGKLVPQRLTLREIPYKADTTQEMPKQREPVHVHIHQRVVMPDELKLVIFGGFVALMAWLMLIAYVATFSKPNVIIIDSTTGRVLP